MNNKPFKPSRQECEEAICQLRANIEDERARVAAGHDTWWGDCSNIYEIAIASWQDYLDRATH